MSKVENSSVQLQGIPFPYGVRELGASIEVLKFEGGKESEVNSWIQKNPFQKEEERWGIIARSKSKEEQLCLTLSFRRAQRSMLRLQSGRLEKIEEESTEPEICEFHLKNKEPILELYSFSAKQRTGLLTSLKEEFGEDSIQELYLTKDAMKSLMAEAIEVSSVSLSGLGNPFFSDATLAGTDPANSKTYRELLASGEIRSFRAKFQTRNDEASAYPLLVTVNSKCKIRFFGGQLPVAQS
ncbi:MAG TPA: hypothetical protein VN739_10040, partial [Nitrososphaerales archaeon]|nr:hypothetical protein [Nitrososphaerales archaeon]